MRKLAPAISVVFASLCLAASAQAAPLCGDEPAPADLTTGCRVNAGNTLQGPGGSTLVVANGGNDTDQAVEFALWDATDGGLVPANQYNLEALTKTDATDFASSGFAVFGLGTKEGTWFDNRSFTERSLHPLKYLTIKAANSFLLFELELGQTQGSWKTLGIFNNGGNQPNVSHITFWDPPPPGTEVPEPTSMLLLGTGLAGAVLRRRAQRSR